MKSRISIVVVNWNTVNYLRNCLRCLQNQQDAPSFQVVVVDNASSDGSAEMVRSEFPECLLSAQSENLGYAQGNNVGADMTDSDWLLFLNPDVELDKTALSRLESFISAHQDTVGVCGLLMNPDGTPQHSVRGFPNYKSLALEILGVARLVPKCDHYFLRSFDYHKEQTAPQPMGALLAVKRELFVSVGKFDQRFPIFFNDVLLCRSLWQHGSIYYSPEISGFHAGGAGTRQVKPKMVVESHRSLIDYLRLTNTDTNHLTSSLCELMIKSSCFVKSRVWLQEIDQRIPKGVSTNRT